MKFHLLVGLSAGYMKKTPETWKEDESQPRIDPINF